MRAGLALFGELLRLHPGATVAALCVAGVSTVSVISGVLGEPFHGGAFVILLLFSRFEWAGVRLIPATAVAMVAALWADLSPLLAMFPVVAFELTLSRLRTGAYADLQSDEAHLQGVFAASLVYLILHSLLFGWFQLASLIGFLIVYTAWVALLWIRSIRGGNGSQHGAGLSRRTRSV